MKKVYISAGVVIGVIVLIILALAVRQRTIEVKDVDGQIYSKHYAFITNLDDKSTMWKEAYEGALQYGKEHDIYVEWFGSDLVETYSKYEIMEMAIAAKVDGIIVKGDDSSEMNDLVNKASNSGIPVIAMWTDCYGSYRNSFVGMSSYNMGQEYGNFIIKSQPGEAKSILVVINSNDNDSSEKLIFAGLKETLYAVAGSDYDVSTIIVDDHGTLSIEESIRNLLLKGANLPDIIVGLDENTTTILSRLMIDYNKVGESALIGFYNSQTIQKAVTNGVITATLTIDGGELGAKCVEALQEYQTSGFVSDYIPIEIKYITGITGKEAEYGE